MQFQINNLGPELSEYYTEIINKIISHNSTKRQDKKERKSIN